MFKAFFTVLGLFASTLFADLIETNYFEIHHAFNENDLQRFNRDITPKLDVFVEAWRAAGVQLPARRTRIYVQPSESLNNEAAINRLFGEQFFRDFENLEAAGKDDPSILIGLVKSFAINYPPFFRKMLHREIAVDRLLVAIGAMRKRLASAEPFSLYGDGACYISLNYYDHNAANAILLSQSTDPAMVHPYFRLDTVLHEIGHQFFSPIFADGRDNVAMKEMPSSLRGCKKNQISGGKPIFQSSDT